MSQPAADLFLPSRLVASIYLYSKHNGAPVYVGQTIQDLVVRDRQHYYNNVSDFDRSYESKEQYSLTVVETKTFDSSTYDGNQRFMIDHCQTWMNDREMHYIAHLKTYTAGLNVTYGGQSRSWLRKMIEKNKEIRQLRFREDYLPSIKRIVAANQDINEPKSWHNLDTTLTRLLYSVRRGIIVAPKWFVKYLTGHGFEMEQMEQMDKTKYEMKRIKKKIKHDIK